MTLADMMLNMLCDEDKERLLVSLLKECHESVLYYYGLDSEESRACLTLLDYTMVDSEYREYEDKVCHQPLVERNNV